MAIVTVSIPTGRPLAYFIPSRTFYDEIGNNPCAYVKDHQYTLREGNIELSEKMLDWRNDNLIKIIEIKEI